MTTGTGRRYRAAWIALVAGALLPLTVAGVGSGAAPPPRTPAHGGGGGGAVDPDPVPPVRAGVTPGVTRLALGSPTAPGAGVAGGTGVPADVPLVPGFAPRGTARWMSLTRDVVPGYRAVGVTWTGGGAGTAVSVAVRGRTGTGPWSPWQAAAPAGGYDADGPGRRQGAQLLWLGTAAQNAVQVTLATTGPGPRDVAADLIDPRQVPADAVPVPPVPATSVDATRVARPPIHTRAEWGADERAMSWPPQYAPAVRALAWHDQPIGGGYAENDVPAILRALYYYDAVSRGWGDLGDNVLVDRFGRLWEGRYGGLSRPVIGAHTPGRNIDTAGVGVLGVPGQAPPATLEAAAQYVAWKLAIGPAVDPRGDTQLPLDAGAPAAPAAPVGAATSAPGAPVSRPAPATSPARAGPAPAAPPAVDRTESVEKKKKRIRTHGKVKPPKAGASPVETADPEPALSSSPKPAATPAAKAPATKRAAKPRVRRHQPPRKVHKRRYPKRKPAGPPTVTVPRVFSADPAVTVLASVRNRAYALMGDWTDPATMRRTLGVWDPAKAAYLEPGGQTGLTGRAGDRPVPADYDGDGRIDQALWTPATGVWTIRNSSAGTTESLTLGHPGDVPVPADYDGDGRADPATWTPRSATWHVRDARDVVFGRPDDTPVPADYTGDGRADLAVYRSSQGLWDISGMGRFRLGEAWHVPVPADYDGDGRADPATWSPTSQNWYVRGRPPVHFGASGDAAVPAQYNGDGKADLAVWHAGSWRIQGVGSYPVGTAGDTPATLG